MTERIVLASAGLAAAAFAVPTSCASATAPCLGFGVWECLGPYDDKIKDVFEQGTLASWPAASPCSRPA